MQARIEAMLKRFLEKLNNVAIVIEDKLVFCQKKKLGLCRGSTLLGLYEEILQIKGGNDYSGVLPNKITIF